VWNTGVDQLSYFVIIIFHYKIKNGNFRIKMYKCKKIFFMEFLIRVKSTSLMIPRISVFLVHM
jgi:hypothetical protein